MKVFNGLTMNKYLLLFLGLSAQGAVEYDFNKGIDLTARTQVTGAHLNQLVDNASLRAGRGLVLITNGIPDTANNPRYTNYLWVDTAIAGSPTLKFYVAGVGWTNSLVGATITETNIAANAITTTKIANGAVTSDKVSSGSIGNLQLGGSAVTTDKISVGAVTRGVIADGAIGTDQITNSAVTTAKIAASAVTADKISTVDWLTITNLPQAVNLYPLLSLTNWTVNAGSNNVLFTGPNGTNASFKPMYESVTFNSPDQPVDNGWGLLFTADHNLGYTPQFVRPVLVFTAAVQGYQIGDEVNLSGFFYRSNASAGYVLPVFQNIKVSNTNISFGIGSNAFHGGAATHGLWFHNGLGFWTNAASYSLTNIASWGVYKAYIR